VIALLVHLGSLHPGAAVDGSSTGIVAYLTVFALAAFVGIEVVSKVPSILHTPLMSGSNAIHGIVLVGALTIMGEAHGAAELVLGTLAVFLATLNIVGGFVVTDRMLEMFKSKPADRPAKNKAAETSVSAAQAAETGDTSGPAEPGGAA
jgi:NAD(P) transhydrogenase subunit alpha